MMEMDVYPCLPTAYLSTANFVRIFYQLPTTLVVRVEQSVGFVCLYVRTITFERLILTLCGSSLKVKVMARR